jgi:hypothetical protein
MGGIGDIAMQVTAGFNSVSGTVLDIGPLAGMFFGTSGLLSARENYKSGRVHSGSFLNILLLLGGLAIFTGTGSGLLPDIHLQIPQASMSGGQSGNGFFDGTRPQQISFGPTAVYNSLQTVRTAVCR